METEKTIISIPSPCDETDFVEQLTPIQRQAYRIAIDHLKTSFDISRSNGFVEWAERANTKHTK
jgi:hypothetical protein